MAMSTQPTKDSFVVLTDAVTTILMLEVVAVLVEDVTTGSLSV